MNPIIRIFQVLLALFALNGIYGLALRFAFSPLSSGQKPSTWNTVGSIVTAFTLGIIIFLLQRYYEIRNSRSDTSIKKFFGIALTGASIAVLIGASVVILIIVLTILSL